MVKFKISDAPDDQPVPVRLVQDGDSVKIKIGEHTVAEFVNGVLSIHQYAHASSGLKAMQAMGILFTKLAADRFRIRTEGMN